MAFEVFDFPQNSPEWHNARLGIPTASCFADILAGGAGKTRASYMRRLAAERITVEPTENFKSPVLDRGHALEDEARKLYAFMNDVEPIQVGFVRSGHKGCSPDSFIGSNGILEIKTQRGDLLIETMLADKFPTTHVAQCQGALWVCEREWIDINCYWPKMQPFIKRAYRDAAYIVALAKAVALFNEELAELVDRIQRYGQREAA